MTESYSGGYERGKRSHLQQPAEDLLQEELKVKDKEKVKRDVRSVKKFIEVALVLDKAMFDKRPHSSRKDVIHDAIQVVNIADLVSYGFSRIFTKKRAKRALFYFFILGNFESFLVLF